MSSQPSRPKPVILVVIDGWGVAPPWGGNATTLAKTPFINYAKKNFPNTTLLASGKAVGLPEGDRGNSEVGHLNIGAGQPVLQYYPAITQAIQDGSFFKNEVLIKAFTRAKETNRAVHLLGLISPGGIHSHLDHLLALLDLAKKEKFTNLYIHAITDGRDADPFEAEKHLSYLEEKIRQVGVGRICTVAGRYYTMDRDHRWDRIEKSYRAMTEGVGLTANSAVAAVASAYRDGFSDEFIPPTVIHGPNNGFTPMMDGDSIIFFNFRGDRAREISQVIAKTDFDGFARKKVLKNIYFVGFTFYQEGLPIEIAFKPHDVDISLAGVLAKAGLKQLHVAESEKYAHVTYFFNGGSEAAFANEKRIVVPSPHVASYDQVPEMSSVQISQTVVQNLAEEDFIVLNYANPDMVGHTGNLRATIDACEAVDNGLNTIYEAIKDNPSAVLIITADHGNAEQMVNPKTGEPDTEHTGNPVPFIIVSQLLNLKVRSGGKLADIAPTILALLRLEKPSTMTGQSLIEVEPS